MLDYSKRSKVGAVVGNRYHHLDREPYVGATNLHEVSADIREFLVSLQVDSDIKGAIGRVVEEPLPAEIIVVPSTAQTVGECLGLSRRIALRPIAIVVHDVFVQGKMAYRSQRFLTIAYLGAHVEHIVSVAGETVVCGKRTSVEVVVLFERLRSPCHFGQCKQSWIQHVFGMVVGSDIFGKQSGLHTLYMLLDIHRQRVGSRVEAVNKLKRQVSAYSLGLCGRSILITVEIAETARGHHCGMAG